MSELADFIAYVNLYEGLRGRYMDVRVVEDIEHESFEIKYLRSESGEWNAWTPNFIDNMQRQKTFNCSDSLLDMALDNLVFMERELNALSQPLEEHQFY